MTQYIQCELCGRHFQRITAGHLGSEHGISMFQYKEIFPDAPIQTDEVYYEGLGGEEAAKNREGKCGGWGWATLTPEAYLERCRRIRENFRSMSPERRREWGRRVSQGLQEYWASLTKEERLVKGLVTSRAMFRYFESLSPEMHRVQFANYKRTEEEKETTGERTRLWWASLSPKKKEEHLRNSFLSEEAISNARRGSAVRPSEPEIFLNGYLTKKFPGEWEYNGLGQQGVMIGGKIPDFININGKKAVIEVFGAYWHDEDEIEPLITHYKRFGFDCLVLWDDECYQEAILDEKILSKTG